MRHGPDVYKAIATARTFMSSERWSRTPVDIKAVATELGVGSVAEASLNIDGYLAVDDDGSLSIRYKAGNTDQRNRFTVAHELGHLLLARVQGREITRSNRAPRRDPREEIAVNRIGSELLMPEDAIIKEVRCRAGQTPWRILTVLKHSLGVSESAIALRMLELRHTACALFRIDVDRAESGRSGRYPLDVSEHGKLRVVGDVTAVTERLWSEASQGTLHTIDVEICGRRRLLRCEGLRRVIRGRGGASHQYWVVGWVTSVLQSNV